MKKILLIPILFFNFFAVQAWLKCIDLLDYYHISFFDVQLQVNDGTISDKGGMVFVARMFHNKILQFVLDFYKRYTRLLDIELFIALFSFVGFIGILFGIWYFLRERNKDLKFRLLFLSSLVFPFIQVFFNPKIAGELRLIFVFGPLFLISLFGHIEFIRKNNNKVPTLVYLICFLISAGWLIVFPQEAYKYCLKP